MKPLLIAVVLLAASPAIGHAQSSYWDSYNAARRNARENGYLILEANRLRQEQALQAQAAAQMRADQARSQADGGEISAGRAAWKEAGALAAEGRCAEARAVGLRAGIFEIAQAVDATCKPLP